MPNKLFEMLLSHYYSKKGFFIGCFVILLFESLLNNLFQDVFALISNAYGKYILYALYILIVIIHYFVWRKLTSLPYLKNKFKATVILSFSTENDRQKILFYNDIIDNVNNLICEHDLQNNIKIVVPKENQVKNINSLFDKYIRKKELHLKNSFEKFVKQNEYSVFIWGNLVQRNDEKEKYFINFSTIAKHSQLNDIDKRQLAVEMSVLLPDQIVMSVMEEFKFINETKSMLYLSIRYITGTILYLSLNSDNVKIAFDIHNGLLEELQMSKYKNTVIALQTKKLYGAELYHMSRLEYENDNCKKSLEYSNLSLNIHPSQFDMLIWNGFLQFDVSKNTGKAIDQFEKAGKTAGTNLIWQYNIAFIYAYERRFPEALNLYDQILRKNSDFEHLIIDQCIKYQEGILKKESDKYQFSFFIGLLTYKKVQNLPLSLQWFEEFVVKANNERHFGVLVKRAKAYIQSIKQEMGVN